MTLTAELRGSTAATWDAAVGHAARVRALFTRAVHLDLAFFDAAHRPAAR